MHTFKRKMPIAVAIQGPPFLSLIHHASKVLKQWATCNVALFLKDEFTPHWRETFEGTKDALLG